MTSTSGYSALERLLHRLAFATTWAQRGTADLERRLYRRELSARQLGAPVLITALPRAGTTILLELIARSPTFASHTYRDMPFVLCPMLWSRIAKRFARADTPRERAHGDGIQLSLDSPEAFEEMLWKLFWPRHYRGPAIATWDRCDEPEFVEFFANHMQKIVALRARAKPTANRYVSKNNLNIARIPAIWGALPQAIVLVPFRDPLQHAASLRHQHERFSKLHAADDFARRYMAGVGHHDFGANLKPIDFAHWFAGRDVGEADRLAFWLDYWIAAYGHVAANAGHDRLHLIRFEALGEVPDLGRLATCLELADPEALQAGARTLKPAKPHRVDASEVPAARLDVAMQLYEQLRARSLL